MPKTVNNTTIANALGLIAPHVCRGCGHIGNILCNCCKNHIINSHLGLCPFCRQCTSACSCQERHSYPPITIIAWRDSLIGALIYDLKYRSIRSAARPLADILNHALPYSLRLILIPLPTINSHIRERGLDHTLLIARHLAKLRKPNTEVSRLLLRSNNATQVGSTRKERLIQAQNAYTVNPRIKIKKDATYLLLDDVWTTGASMLSATKILQQKGITNLAIASLTLSR